MSSGNGGDKDREAYYQAQRGALVVVGHALRARIGSVGAAGLLIGVAGAPSAPGVGGRRKKGLRSGRPLGAHRVLSG